MTRVISWTVLILLILTCSGINYSKTPRPVTQGNLTVLNHLYPDLVDALPDRGIFRHSGDSLIFAGLLAYSGEYSFCEDVEAAQLPDGSFARSAWHRLHGDLDFSRDQGMGVLFAAMAGCLSSLDKERFVSYLNVSGGYLAGKRDSKTYTNGGYRYLVELVMGYPVQGSSRALLTLTNTIQPWINTNYHLHLDSLTSYTLIRNNISTPSLPRFTAKEPGNPWFQYLVGNRDEAADILIHWIVNFLREGPPDYAHSEWLDWAWQRPMRDNPRATGWELLFLSNLLLQEEM